MGLAKFWLGLRVGGARLQRLKREIESTRDELQGYAKTADAARQLKAAKSALARADTALRDRHYDDAWEALHEARRHEVFCYDNFKLVATARTLHEEASSKLGSWRQAAVIQLLAPILNCTRPAEEEKTRLAVAIGLRDEHYDNQYFKLRLVQKQVLLLLLTLLLLLIMFMALFSWEHSALMSSNSAVGPGKLLAGILAGAIGACFSGLLSLVSTSIAGTIPERVASTTITFARPAIGAASGFAAILLLSAGFLSNFPATAILAVAFAFGFSERLAVGALEKVGSR